MGLPPIRINCGLEAVSIPISLELLSFWSCPEGELSSVLFSLGILFRLFITELWYNGIVTYGVTDPPTTPVLLVLLLFEFPLNIALRLYFPRLAKGVCYRGKDRIPALVARLRSGDNSYPTNSVGVKPCCSRI